MPGQIRYDAAVRLMVHQLAYLSNVAAIDNELGLYSELTEVCRKRATPKGWDVAETSVEDDPDFVNQ